MYSAEQRKIAIETFVKFDHSYADAIAELGYPTRACLRNWWNEYRDTGEVPISKFTTNPRYTAEMKRRAVEHYLEHGRSLARTMRALGYPKSREVLGDWIDEIAPGQRKYRGPNPKRDPVPVSPGSMACRGRRPAFGAGRLWGIMAGTPRRKASP